MAWGTNIWTSKEADMQHGDDTRVLLGEIDAYIEGLFAPRDEALEAALEESRRAGLPGIQISPNEGVLLAVLAQIAGARRILELLVRTFDRAEALDSVDL